MPGNVLFSFLAMSMLASRPPRPHSGVGTVDHSLPSQWTMSGPNAFVPTAQTSFVATASTPRMSVPGMNVVRVHCDPSQCSASACQMTCFGRSITRAPTAHTSLELTPETSSSG